MNLDKHILREYNKYTKYEQLNFSYIKPNMLTMNIINKYSNIITVSKSGDIDDTQDAVKVEHIVVKDVTVDE